MATVVAQDTTAVEGEQKTLRQSYSFENVEFMAGDVAGVDTKASASIAEAMTQISGKKGADAISAGADFAALIETAGARSMAECE
eukprot:2194931-Rhodomonas_salina.3